MVVSLYTLIFRINLLSYALLYNYIQFTRSIQIQIQSFFVIHQKEGQHPYRAALPHFTSIMLSHFIHFPIILHYILPSCFIRLALLLHYNDTFLDNITTYVHTLFQTQNDELCSCPLRCIRIRAGGIGQFRTYLYQAAAMPARCSILQIRAA